MVCPAQGGAVRSGLEEAPRVLGKGITPASGAAQNIGLADDIKKRALALEQSGIKAIDALHLACAEAAGANHFLTCDDRLIRRYSGQMVVQSPVTFINNLN